ncbi:MAG: hypothetical protein NVSMB63_03720 [Sediminibacterium sp.]
MPLLKAYIKKIIYQLRLAAITDTLVYRWQQLQYYHANKQFRQAHPELVLPSDYILYESFRLHYQKFIEEGHLAAKEIAAWTTPYLQEPHPLILDWGCGAGRITRHLLSVVPNARLYACDTNPNSIRWNCLHYPGIQFTTIDHLPPTHYQSSCFDLIYGISVLTHIVADEQSQWITELHRLLRPNGLLLVSTHGSHYYQQLIPVDLRKLEQTGSYTHQYLKKGHRMLSTYNKATALRSAWEEKFNIVAFYDGVKHPHKLGGQDLWLLQKK